LIKKELEKILDAGCWEQFTDQRPFLNLERSQYQESGIKNPVSSKKPPLLTGAFLSNEISITY
jgi:hypothetical protein